MTTIKYTLIKSQAQYDKYCERLMDLDTQQKLSKDQKDEFELLELLANHWEEKFYQKYRMEPIKLLKYLMDNHNLSNNDLADELGIGKSAVSQILSYKKGLSKEVIRKLANRFKVSQEAFNQITTLKVDKKKSVNKKKFAA
ncbi:MAG TPA: helix-turn-helix domain-containing protein [Bacteroidia bacterium]|nr:helix-turn-helix domain-containing protein [Bacteroidia bacterium]